MITIRIHGHAARTHRAAPTLCLLAGLACAGTPALAQPPQPPAPQGQPQTPANPADQLVGLFGATCLHFAANPSGLRGFLTQQGAPVMPAQAREAFLAGRAGQVFDVSVPGVNLALVSLDDGGCEAVAEKANRDEVVANLQTEAREANDTITPVGAQADTGPNGVQHAAFQITASGKQMHVLVSTAPAPPQAVITLAPK
jgi:hypothetical protein